VSAGPTQSDFTRGLFGRRKGKPLSPRQQGAYDRLLPVFRIDPGRRPPAALGELFSAPPEEIFVEIGFGGGEHLIERARSAPGVGFIGVEPYVNGVARLLAEVDELKLPNIRVFDADAAVLLDWLPPASLAGIDLLYPDPWPKRRHWNRRFVNRRNLDLIARVLRTGGLFRFVSDIDHYVNWTLQLCRNRPDLRWMADTAENWRRPWPGWTGTRYEAKAICEGRFPSYLCFERVDQIDLRR
jgi:tRNA (guanine-N7-)-methyltransferase